MTEPATGQVLEVFPSATDAQVQSGLSTADKLFADWRRVSVADRAAVLRRIAQAFAEHAEELAATMALEMGKSHAEGLEEAESCREIFAYYADEGPRLLADEPLPTPGAVLQKRPIGTVLGIMPWNFPGYQVARFTAPNLVAGNAVVLKPAESVPRSALILERLITEAGAPYVNLFATHTQIETVIADPRVQGVSFTGSERAGSAVGALAGRHLKKCVLELGGSDPFIVLDTDDVEALAELAWTTRLYNRGQACNSNKRIIVAAEHYDAFVAALAELAAQAGSTGPLASRAAAETVAALVDDAVARGATLHAGGVLGPGAFYSPAVLTGVTDDMRAFHEELFGPVAVVYRVRSDQEAVDLANRSAYGLGAAVFSTDPARAARVADLLDAGMVNVNTPAATSAALPFGGVKRSGFGRELGPLGVTEFVNHRLFFTAS
ncbi:aldehyde dehydrogenase family protein [Amycolatopsis rhabdoformis]|uniref:Aldehyde dehydrogenase family protein n=1 Tax=Amycolatopsis rhabdoformis TaxID=1448059 RepID=A0ABZ1IJ92_9PSEU|nr:aldehyde dehydrogenase family protein [Amycolatopsis rhabdoformis]WSE34490.1 aldehyde dehydrogenase family protein [Amycolatopsis rhabdoformis]